MTELAVSSPTLPPAPRRRQASGMEGLLIASWVLAMLGAAATVVGIVLAGAETAADLDGPSARLGLGVPTALIGGLILLAALSAASYRSIVLRRDLGEDRYRGPSILILLAIVLVAGTLATLPLLGSFMNAIEGSGPVSELETVLLLGSTSVALLLAAFVFVGLPRALPGVRMLPASLRETWQPIGLGVLIGGPAWLASTVIAVVVSAGVSAVLGEPPDEQIFEQIVPQIHPLAAVGILVIAAPIAEEIFFRGIVFNAWLREYGFRRALIGSSLLFALIHASLFAFVPILLLALVLGYVYSQTRSLLTVIAIHATYNAISTALILIVSAA